MKSLRPIIIASKCLGFDACRYNAQVVPDDFVKKLEAYVDYVTVCPEVEIGLGVPRDPIRLVKNSGKIRLVQPATGRDVTEDMGRFVSEFLAGLGEVDGIILKNKSPSCGIGDVRVYSGPDASQFEKGEGFFGGVMKHNFQNTAIEDEGRLKNHDIREHFLTAAYAFARFRQVRSEKALLRFHSENKLLLMAYDKGMTEVMGQIVAKRSEDPIGKVRAEYLEKLGRSLSRKPERSSVINTLMHVLGYFKERISPREKAFFLERLEDYKANLTCLGSVQDMLKSWVIRFEDEYLERQSFFEPYPRQLIGSVEECIRRKEK